MKTRHTLTIATAILALTAALGLSPRDVPVAFAATDTFTVTTTVDLTTCKTIGPQSLRCAIIHANAKPAGDTKFIRFSIAGCPGTICKIQPSQQPLPTITTNNLTIDGYTQPGATPNSINLHKPGGDNAVLKVQVDGLKAPGANGFTIQGSNDTIRGLSITNFKQGFAAPVGGAGIAIIPPSQQSSPPHITNNKVIGNFIGLLPDGKSPGPNHDGVAVFGAFSNNSVKLVTGESIGSASAGDRNVISGNTRYGIYLSTSARNQILGNFIGTDSTGMGPDANLTGIYLTGEGVGADTSSGDVIGVPNAGNTGGNVISGNTIWGIFGDLPIQGKKIKPDFTLIPFNFYEMIQNNHIGVNNPGVGAIPNGSAAGGGGGILSKYGVGWTIGGGKTATNVISGNNGDGIHLFGPGGNNTISFNLIGLSAAANALRPNKGNGVELEGAGSGNTLSAATVSHNKIAGNTLFGVQVGSADVDNGHNLISLNSMFANNHGGIGLFHQLPDQCIFGPFGGLDTANDYMGCPLVKSATPQTGVTGEAPANSTVEVYIAPNGTDDEGKTLLGTTTASDCPHALQPSCWGTWTLAPGAFNVPLSKGQFITATATSTATTLENPSASPPAAFVPETSQFSRDVPVGQELIVTTTSDSASTCPGSSCSLRGAMTQANTDGAGDLIDFNIPNSDPNCSGGVCKLDVGTLLPAVKAPSTFINGFSQPGTSPSTNSLLQGDNAQIGLLLQPTGTSITTGNGLDFQAQWDGVQGFSIQGFTDPTAGAGIHLDGAKAVWDMVMGDFVGLDPSGAASPSGQQNNQGVTIDGGAIHGLIGFRTLGDVNSISGNANYGVFNEEGGTVCLKPNPNVFAFCNNVVYGNFIGVDPSGTQPRGNGVSGIFLYGSQHNVIGAGGGQLGNIIGGNLSDGIDGITSDFDWIAGNNIGNAVNGAGGVGNGVAGIFLYGGRTSLVGGPTGFFLNAVGGNAEDGIDALAEPGIAVWNNIVGKFTTVIQSAPNGGDGVFLGNTTTFATPQLRLHHVPARIISRLASRSGSSVVGFNTMQGFASDNTIQSNGLDGIQLGQQADDNDLHIVMSGNIMGGNGTGGIHFTGFPVSDCFSPPTNGPNDGIACPYISGATNNGSTLAVFGYDHICIGCTIEVFQSSNEHGGYGEGETYLGSVTVQNSGYWELDLNTPAVAIKGYVTATATGPGTSNLLPETSEFAANYQVTGCNPQAPNC